MAAVQLMRRAVTRCRLWDWPSVSMPQRDAADGGDVLEQEVLTRGDLCRPVPVGPLTVDTFRTIPSTGWYGAPVFGVEWKVMNAASLLGDLPPRLELFCIH